MSALVSDICRALDRAFPAAWAEPWDRVGLLVGDPATTVAGVRVALDVTHAEIDATVATGANVLVTHHPAFLQPIESVTAGFGPEGVAHRAASRGVALICAHTNLDRAPEGAASLPRALGLGDGVPLEEGSQAVDIVTVYAPPSSVESLRAVLEDAGAGRVGDYSGCAFVSTGEGSFRPAATSSPYVGEPGMRTTAEESRIEVVAPRGRGAGIAAHAARTHPYEEPLITVVEGAIARGAARLGRVCELSQESTLGSFASLVAARLDCVPRVWGDADGVVRRVACATGSGGSLVNAAISRGCDVLIAGEVRYHDALAALERGLRIIEAGHDVTEWPLVPVLASAVALTEGIEDVAINVASSGRGWWTP